MSKKIKHIPEHAEISSTPSTPATGFSKIYPKTDKEWYWLDDTGAEVPFRSVTFTGSTLWVDSTYGNDTTALVNRFDKPYQTYSAARSAAPANSTIVFRPGVYSEGFYDLKNNVNVYCYPGTTLIGQIRDNGVQVEMKWMGYADASYSGNSVISITGSYTNVDMNFRNLSSVGIGIFVNSGTNPCYLKLRCNNLTGTQLNYTISLRGNANVNLFFEDSIQSSNPTSPSFGYWMIDCRNGYNGTSYIKANRVIIGDSTLDGAGRFFVDNASNSVNGKIYIEVNTLTSLFSATAIDDINATILKIGLGLTSIKVNEMTTISKPCIASTGVISGSGATFIFEGKATCQNREAVVLAFPYAKHVFKNCTFHRLSGGTDDNRVIVTGTPTGANPLGYAASDNINAEFINTKIVKTSAGTSSNELIMIDGLASTTIFKNCEIIGINTPSGSDACNADTLAEGNIYFKNTNSNLDNTANITDTASVSGFIGNDYNLTTYDI